MINLKESVANGEKMAAETQHCVDKNTFYKKLDKLKASRKTSNSNANVFNDNELYDNAIKWLQNKVNTTNTR